MRTEWPSRLKAQTQCRGAPAMKTQQKQTKGAEGAKSEQSGPGGRAAAAQQLAPGKRYAPRGISEFPVSGVR